MAGPRSFGAHAALLAMLASIAYDIPQLLQIAGWLSDPWDRVAIFAPSLLLAPAFACTMAAAVDLAGQDERAQARAASALAIMYAVLVSGVYIVQLGVVIPRELRGDASAAALACCAARMPMTALDLLGYSLMSVSLWLLALALPRQASGALRPVLLVNGALVFVIFGQLLWPGLIYPAALWLVSFPAAMWLLRRRFLAQ